MDMIAVDLTPCPLATIGSKVEMWGDKIKIDQVASISNTIANELMCALTPRVNFKLV
jgi:alanine racemase